LLSVDQSVLRQPADVVVSVQNLDPLVIRLSSREHRRPRRQGANGLAVWILAQHRRQGQLTAGQALRCVGAATEFVFPPDFFAQAASFFFARAIETLLLAAFRLGLASGFRLALGGGGAHSLTVGERDVRRLRA